MARIVKTAEERRREFIAAAQKLFLNQGYDNTTVSDIIRAVGLSKGAYYHHFDSKYALLEILVDQTVAELNAITEPVMQEPGLDAITRWNLLVESTNHWKLANREQLLSMLRSIYRDENIRYKQMLNNVARQHAVRLFTQVIEQGIEEDLFDVMYPVQTARLLVAAQQSLSDKAATLLLGKEQTGISDELEQLFAAAQQMTERTLGAPQGSLPIIDPETLSAWFLPADNDPLIKE